MKYLIIATMLILTGCVSEQEVANSVNRLNRKCEPLGGVKSIYSMSQNNCVRIEVTCMNGTVIVNRIWSIGKTCAIL